jgi:hypothetical protein
VRLKARIKVAVIEFPPEVERLRIAVERQRRSFWPYGHGGLSQAVSLY